MTTETNAERLERISNTDKYMYDRSGKHVSVNAQDFNFLVQQAERTQELENDNKLLRAIRKEQEQLIRIFNKEDVRLQEALMKLKEDLIPLLGVNSQHNNRITDICIDINQALKGESE